MSIEDAVNSRVEDAIKYLEKMKLPRQEKSPPWMTVMLNDLLDITSGCREDMHEPDEQGVEAKVVGFTLDNAMGDSIIPKAMKDGWQEFVVTITKESKGKKVSKNFNLASLIALAKKAAV